MERLIILLVLILVGCSNKLNEFEFADAIEQASFAQLLGLDDDDYFRLLKNNDIVYFDTKFEEKVIVKPKDEFEFIMRDSAVGVYYDSFVETETTTYNEIEYIQEGSKNVQKHLRKYGYNNVIYVIQDANGDLVFRATNGEVDYNYFDTKEAKKIYEDYMSKKESSEKESSEEESSEKVDRIQYRVTDNETYLENSEDYMGSSNTSIYAESVASCLGRCDSKYMTYREAVNLIDQESEKGFEVYEEWWEENKSRIQKNN